MPTATCYQLIAMHSGKPETLALTLNQQSAGTFVGERDSWTESGGNHA